MTRNQLTYQANIEAARHNLAQEREDYRSNLARETETHRSNVANENEIYRSNRERELETHRQNREMNAINRYSNATARMNAATQRLSMYNQNAYWQRQASSQERQASANERQARASMLQAQNAARYQAAMSTAALSQADVAKLQARQSYALGQAKLKEEARRNDLTYEVAARNAATQRYNVMANERLIDQNIRESRVRTEYIPLNAFIGVANAGANIIRSTSKLVEGGVIYGW